MFDLHYRIYQQDQASFYFDLLPQGGAQTYQGRDKELSQFTSRGIGIGASYEFLKNGWWKLDKGNVSFGYERMDFDYDNFSDYEGLVGTTNTQGRPFAYSADVFELYFSVWY
jgi:hypothetical protein